MGVFSNAVHVRSDDYDGVVRAYSSLLRRQGYRPRASGTIPHYLETADEAIFRRVLISQPRHGWVTLVDQRHDDQNLRSMSATTGAVSRALGCSAVCFVVHDSEVFYYFHWNAGELVDRYCSWPAWYADHPPSRAVRRYWRGKPAALVALCRGGIALRELRALLRDYSQSQEPMQPPVWAEEILEDVADALGIESPLRTYHAYHARPTSLYLAVPDPHGGAHGCIRLEREEPSGPSWSSFTHYEFMRVTGSPKG